MHSAEMPKSKFDFLRACNIPDNLISQLEGFSQTQRTAGENILRRQVSDLEGNTEAIKEAVEDFIADNIK